MHTRVVLLTKNECNYRVSPAGGFKSLTSLESCKAWEQSQYQDAPACPQSRFGRGHWKAYRIIAICGYRVIERPRLIDAMSTLRQACEMTTRSRRSWSLTYAHSLGDDIPLVAASGVGKYKDTGNVVRIHAWSVMVDSLESFPAKDYAQPIAVSYDKDVAYTDNTCASTSCLDKE